LGTANQSTVESTVATISRNTVVTISRNTVATTSWNTVASMVDLGTIWGSIARCDDTIRHPSYYHSSLEGVTTCWKVKNDWLV
jgi:hypothetical protein